MTTYSLLPSKRVSCRYCHELNTVETTLVDPQCGKCGRYLFDRLPKMHKPAAQEPSEKKQKYTFDSIHRNLNTLHPAAQAPLERSASNMLKSTAALLVRAMEAKLELVSCLLSTEENDRIWLDVQTKGEAIRDTASVLCHFASSVNALPISPREKGV